MRNKKNRKQWKCQCPMLNAKDEILNKYLRQHNNTFIQSVKLYVVSWLKSHVHQLSNALSFILFRSLSPLKMKASAFFAGCAIIIVIINVSSQSMTFTSSTFGDILREFETRRRSFKIWQKWIFFLFNAGHLPLFFFYITSVIFLIIFILKLDCLI